VLVLAGALLALGFGAISSRAGIKARQTTALPVTVSVTSSHTTLFYPLQHAYSLRFSIRTGSQAEKITIWENYFPSAQSPAALPRWPDPRVYGEPWSYGDPVFLGPGLAGGSGGHGDVPAATCVRGGLQSATGFEADLPADANTTVVQLVDVAAPPWPGMNWTPKLWVSTATAPAPVLLSAPHIRMAGRSGVHIRMRSIPPIPKAPFGSLYPSFAPGHALTVQGTTDPIVARGRIRLSATVWTAARPQGYEVRVGSALTDKRGRFHAKPWRPTVPGTYLINAHYSHPRRDLLADSNCDLSGFEVRHP
jgi:hypothetical protein